MLSVPTLLTAIFNIQARIQMSSIDNSISYDLFLVRSNDYGAVYF